MNKEQALVNAGLRHLVHSQRERLSRLTSDEAIANCSPTSSS